mmetsp:Transcript_40431/g.89815  ORF Transcript_40431/g.89815 Transcript_40431/m.89815 type:complete len:206 (+) Transcript_40431:1976-2593(+)
MLGCPCAPDGDAAAWNTLNMFGALEALYTSCSMAPSPWPEVTMLVMDVRGWEVNWKGPAPRSMVDAGPRPPEGWNWNSMAEGADVAVPGRSPCEYDAALERRIRPGCTSLRRPWGDEIPLLWRFVREEPTGTSSRTSCAEGTGDRLLARLERPMPGTPPGTGMTTEAPAPFTSSSGSCTTVHPTCPATFHASSAACLHVFMRSAF